MEPNLLRTVLKPSASRRPNLPRRNNPTSFNNIDFSPLHWSNYFEECRDLDVKESNGKFRVYLSGFKNNSTNSNAPVLVLLHGGGYSALTWSLFVKSINEICDCKIVALDLRGHGSTVTNNDYDLSVQTIVDDIYNVLICLFSEDNQDKESLEMYRSIYEPIKEPTRLPNISLVGHSMGGALAVHSAYKLSKVCTINGLIVIDVVEGTALDALQSMHLVLKNRQSSFNTVNEAVEWCVRNNQTKNIEAARISFPGQIKNRFTNKTATDEYELNKEEGTLIDKSSANHLEDHAEVTDEQGRANFEKKCTISDDAIPEDEEFTPMAIDHQEGKYVWRINLFKSEPHWKSWFENLSSLFLNAPVNGRLLLLAGIDRLDKDLTVGQMQGKFQMQVLPQCGHSVHEDVPDKVAEAIATYLIRNKLTQKKKQFNPTFPCC